MRGCRARLLGDDDADPALAITLPGGETLVGAEIERALSELLERRVRLERSAGQALGRLGATGAHHDAAPVHLVTTSTLAHLRRVAPESDWDVRRFRPNLVLEDGDGQPGGFGEDRWLGSRLCGESGLELSVELPTPRCVVPTRAQDGLAADPRILRTLVERHRVDLGVFGSQGCLGAYAEVAHGGELRVGGRLEVRPGSAEGHAAIRATIARLTEAVRRG